MLNDYRNFFDSLELLLFVLDPDGIIIYCNKTACDCLGYTKEELIGMPVIDIHPQKMRASAKKLIDDMLIGKEDKCPIPVQCKDGSLIQVETKVSLGIWQGKPALFGVVKDVTELKLSNDKFSTIFQFCPIPIAITGVVDGKIYNVNNAWIDFTGYGLDEIKDKTMLDLQLYRDKKERDLLINKLEKDGFLNSHSVIMKVKNGRTVVGQFSAAAIVINGINCWITAMVDMTDQVKLEEAIRKFRDTVKKKIKLT